MPFGSAKLAMESVPDMVPGKSLEDVSHRNTFGGETTAALPRLPRCRNSGRLTGRYVGEAFSEGESWVRALEVFVSDSSNSGFVPERLITPSVPRHTQTPGHTLVPKSPVRANRPDTVPYDPTLELLPGKWLRDVEET